jgi:N-acetylglutamate synthase-like GNAT family acetyltransferase
MPPKIAIRFAAAVECQALEALQRRASLANAGDRAALIEHPEAIVLPAEQIAAGQVIVAEAEGEVAGFAVVLPRSDGEAELDGLFVEPQAWKGGVGRALVEASSDLARDLGAGVLQVLANPHALGFYEACGFERLGTEATQFGTGVRMQRALGRS